MSLAALNAAFPERPLRIDAPISSWRGWVFGALLLLFPAGFGWWAADSIVPNLLQDVQLRGAAVPVNGRITDGRCRSRWALLQTCDMTVSAGRTKDGGTLTAKLEYIFVQPHVGDYTVQVMADPGRPGLLTTDMGLDNLTNRAVTAGVMGLLVLGFGAMGIALMGAGGREKRRLRGLSGRRLQPVPSYVAKSREGWTVTPVDGAGKSVWNLPAKTEPFWLDPEHGIALAVTVPGAAIFPLDRDLRWADLTDEERNRLRALATQPA